jgi:hypothetical protein
MEKVLDMNSILHNISANMKIPMIEIDG